MAAPSLLFWRRYLSRPLGIGAVAPSSAKLARAMVDALGARDGDAVVELGPGTGVFTRQLLKQGVSPDRLILVEFDPDFVIHLRKTFAGVTVIEGDARHLPDILPETGRKAVPRILSGLPLRSMPVQVRMEIGDAVARALEPGGVLVQFTYFNAPPLPKMTSMNLRVERAGKIMANIPPAYIWRYVK